VDTAATVVWIAPDPADSEQRRAIAGWASAHDVRLAEPAEWAPPPLAVDDHAAAEVEDLLERARDAIAAADGPAVDAELARADALLRASAALPQAAWLMAEVERTRAVRWRRIAPADPEAADRAWRRAEALDGGRRPGISEQQQRADPPPAAASIDLPALVAPEEAWLDGRPAGRHVDAFAGPHAIVVTWNGEPVWAEWRDVPAGSSTWDLGAPQPPPCSSVDFASARLDGDRIASPSVRCTSWVAALPSPHGARAVRIADCERDRCGPLVEWRLPEPWTTPAPPPVAHGAPEKHWPAWATWTLVGAGAAACALSAVALVATLRTPPAETRFVSGGLRTE
jgi:hypothetical protein